MAPSRKSKSVYKRFTKEATPEIDFRNSSKIKQRKKKLTDKLGPQWTKGELERFYDAYRKHGGDWKKVAAAVRNNRSVDMVEALFHMNRAYLSLPEGTASVAGLIAMMTDHYSVIEGSESEGEGHGASGVPVKHQKRKRVKVPPSDFREEVIPPHSIASTEGCLSFFKMTQAYGIERRATAKRTPRFPVPSADKGDDREGSTPRNKRAKKQLDADDDDDDDETLALALANVTRSGGGSLYRKTKLNDSTPSGKMSQAKDAQSKYRASSMFENGVKISRDRRHIKDMGGVGTVEVRQKEIEVSFEEAEGFASDDSGEACSANERLRSKPQKGLEENEASRDELEALYALSALLPTAGLMKSESPAQSKEERVLNNVDEKSNTPVTASTSHHREKAKQAGPEDSHLHGISVANNRKLKSAQELVGGNAVSIGELGTLRRKRKPLHYKDSAEDDHLKTLVKVRRAGEGPVKQLKILKTSEESSSISDKKITVPDAVVSATQISGSGPPSSPKKPPHWRKMSLKKSLQERAKSSETTHDKPHNYETLSKHELLKEEVSTCLSYPLVRRRCIYEWFYSAIDYPWFAKMEFTDYLNHVGLGHVPRLTRLEWSVIKSSLGRPRRFSERFIQEERDKLEQYRESVRKHYTELRAGAREGLPTDLAQPLSVGNRVIAIHPKTREIRDGKILTVDHNKCNVLFDELGVDLVSDIDCMPLNPLEYMPEGLRRQMDNGLSISKEAQLNRHPNPDASVLFPPSVLENVNVSMNPPLKQVNNCRLTDSIGEHQPLDNSITTTNGSLDHHHQSSTTAELMTQGLIGSRKNETQMASELISSCVSTWLMIQMCTEKQYPPADVAQVMETAVNSLQPRCPQNMPIYREIQTCMGWIKNQIMALVKT
ncbi:unnamed protein product [Thlaspi arvense]|uniref:SANT domain-containing protein n=1 Tax=Thlaspi arvense TaxID=13288 RepID=A0AAU9RKI3_THLAR|nr:unnamed protein product [Thlaspi arvense]